MSIKTMLKLCGAAAFFLLIVAALGPEKCVPRSGLGWRVDHFCGYFALSLMFCFVWPRPFLAGGALMAVAILLEGLQAFTPDRHADFYAAMISAGGAMAAILPAGVLIRAPRRSTAWALVRLRRRRLLMVLHRGVAPRSPALGGGIASAGLVTAAAAILLSGCTSDNAFPAVHDMPAARSETKLTPDQVKQATDNLISDRDRIEAKAGGVQSR